MWREQKLAILSRAVLWKPNKVWTSEFHQCVCLCPMQWNNLKGIWKISDFPDYNRKQYLKISALSTIELHCKSNSPLYPDTQKVLKPGFFTSRANMYVGIRLFQLLCHKNDSFIAKYGCGLFTCKHMIIWKTYVPIKWDMNTIYQIWLYR